MGPIRMGVLIVDWGCGMTRTVSLRTLEFMNDECLVGDTRTSFEGQTCRTILKDTICRNR